MHNNDIGRWFAPDPYGQFHSPYVSMGNNPVSMTDPDGGYANPHPHSAWVRLKAWVRRQGWMDGGFFGGGGGEWFTSFDDGGGGNTGGGGDGGSNGWNSGSYGGISSGTGNSEYGVHGGGGGIGSGGGGGGSAFAANFMRPGQANHYSQNSDGTYSVTAAPSIDPSLSASISGPVGPGPKSSGLQQKNSAPNSTRNYGGDGSGSFYDNTLFVLDQINQFNPIANGWDAMTGYVYGKDRFGNAQSTFETTIKAAIFLPFGKAASIGSIAAKGGTSVLGKYPNYINLAEQLGAKRFNVPANIWNKMSAAEQWGANQKFLDRMIMRGDKIILSNPVLDVNKVSGAFRQELDYLIEKGYKLNSTGTQLIK